MKRYASLQKIYEENKSQMLKSKYIKIIVINLFV